MKIYSYQEVKAIHDNANGDVVSFDTSIGDWTFILTSVLIEEIQQVSIWQPEHLSRLSEESEEKKRILELVEAINKEVKLPPVILGLKDISGYDLRDGKHRLSAMKYLRKENVDAFVRYE